MPNESGFWIPDTGANKDNQVSMDSEAYYQANKIAFTRFVIPHAKLANTGGWVGFDSYVPAGRMIIVDRAPYYREWTMSAHRGTSAKDESAPCQTREGINITTEVGISTAVAEANSAKFLHFFGVNNPAGDRSDPQVIFTSVYSGPSLAQVMDGIGRGLVHTAICHEIASRSFDDANANANQIMEAVQKEAGKFLGERGITLEIHGLGRDLDVRQGRATSRQRRLHRPEGRPHAGAAAGQGGDQRPGGLGQEASRVGEPLVLAGQPRHGHHGPAGTPEKVSGAPRPAASEGPPMTGHQTEALAMSP